MDSESSISVRVEGVALNFRGVGADDHVLAVMRESGAIYEQSVLLKILHQLNGRKGAAVDAGAFIGTHSVFFSRICGLAPVLAFEADPETFTVLSQNLKDNDARSVVAQNVALGNRIGRAELRPGGLAILPVPIQAQQTVEYGEARADEHHHVRDVRAPGLDYYDRYRSVFERVDEVASGDFDPRYQLFALEPHEGRVRARRDLVPLCYKE